MRLFRCVLFLLLAAGCSDCRKGGAGSKATPEDAGHARASLPATDLRSALVLAYPEFRGARVLDGSASLTRRVQWSGNPAEVLPALLASRQYQNVEEENGATVADHPPFRFRAARGGEGTFSATVSLPLDEGTVQKLFHAPTAMGTEHLSTLLPRLPGEGDAEETFVLELRYQARPERAAFMVWQLLGGLLSIGWEAEGSLAGLSPDGGAASVPLQFDGTIRQPENGGRLRVVRDAGSVQVRYEQPVETR